MSEEDDHSFQRLVLEAVRQCAPDFSIQSVEAALEAHLGKLTPTQQAKVKREIERVLSFREPDAPYTEN